MLYIYKSNHGEHTVILSSFIYLHQFHVDVCLDGYLTKHFTDFPIKMEEAKIMSDPVILVII
jgi:hypothetical protein